MNWFYFYLTIVLGLLTKLLSKHKYYFWEQYIVMCDLPKLSDSGTNHMGDKWEDQNALYSISVSEIMKVKIQNNNGSGDKKLIREVQIQKTQI